MTSSRLCATATAALFGPRRLAIWWYWAATSAPLVRAAARADSIRVRRSHWLPAVVPTLRRLPADSWLPGHRPAHDASCPGVGEQPLSAPPPAARTTTPRRWLPPVG